MARTAIIIPTHNALPQLAATLSSLAWVEGREDVTLVVADAASQDGTQALLAEAAPWALLVEGDESMWWAASTNAGCRAAVETLACEAMCLLNHDCWLIEEAFDALMEQHRRHPADIISSRVVIDHGRTVFFAGGTQAWTGMLTMRGLKAPTSARFPSGPVVWCGGMGVAVGAGLWRELGGFDEVTFPHYHADADFCLRARANGAVVLYCDEAVVSNDRSSSGFRIDRENATLAVLLETLTSQRSPYKVSYSVAFYRRHLGRRWLLALAHLYGIHLGSGMKRIVSRVLRDRGTS